MLIIHVTRSATISPIAFCLFIFKVVGFIIDDLKKITSFQELLSTIKIIAINKVFTKIGPNKVCNM